MALTQEQKDQINAQITTLVQNGASEQEIMSYRDTAVAEAEASATAGKQNPVQDVTDAPVQAAPGEQELPSEEPLLESPETGVEEPKTAVDKAKKEDPGIGAWENFTNNVENTWTRILGFDDRATMAINDTLENLIGERATDIINTIIPTYDTETGEWYSGTDEVRAQAYKNMRASEAETKETFGIIDAAESKDPFKIISAAGGAGLNILSTLVTNAMTGGAGLYTDMVGDAIADANRTKAERIYGDDSEESLRKLYDSDQSEFMVPAAVGIGGGLLERAGIKGVSKYINSITPGVTKSMVAMLNNMGKEGGTEWLQTGLESFNNARAAGDDAAALTALETMFSREGAEAALQGAIGAGVSGGAGRALKGAASSVGLTGVAETIADNVEYSAASDASAYAFNPKDATKPYKSTLKAEKEAAEAAQTTEEGVEPTPEEKNAQKAEKAADTRETNQVLRQLDQEFKDSGIEATPENKLAFIGKGLAAAKGVESFDEVLEMTKTTGREAVKLVSKVGEAVRTPDEEAKIFTINNNLFDAKHALQFETDPVVAEGLNDYIADLNKDLENAVTTSNRKILTASPESVASALEAATELDKINKRELALLDAKMPDDVKQGLFDGLRDKRHAAHEKAQTARMDMEKTSDKNLEQVQGPGHFLNEVLKEEVNDNQRNTDAIIETASDLGLVQDFSAPAIIDETFAEGRQPLGETDGVREYGKAFGGNFGTTLEANQALTSLMQQAKVKGFKLDYEFRDVNPERPGGETQLIAEIYKPREQGLTEAIQAMQGGLEQEGQVEVSAQEGDQFITDENGRTREVPTGKFAKPQSEGSIERQGGASRRFTGDFAKGREGIQAKITPATEKQVIPSTKQQDADQVAIDDARDRRAKLLAKSQLTPEEVQELQAIAHNLRRPGAQYTKEQQEAVVGHATPTIKTPHVIGKTPTYEGGVIQEPGVPTGDQSFEGSFDREGEVTGFTTTQQRFASDLGKQSDITDADVLLRDDQAEKENIIKKLSGAFANQLAGKKVRTDVQSLDRDDFSQIARQAITEVVNSPDFISGKDDLIQKVIGRYNNLTRKIIEGAGPLPIPARTRETYRLIKKASRKLENDLQREPTIEEIAREMGETESVVRNTLTRGSEVEAASRAFTFDRDEEGNLGFQEPGVEDTPVEKAVTSTFGGTLLGDNQDTVIERANQLYQRGEKGRAQAQEVIARGIKFTGSKGVKLEKAADIALTLQERGFNVSAEQIYNDYLGPIPGRKGETLNQKSKADRSFKNQLAKLILEEAVSAGKLGGVSTRSQTLEFSTPELNPDKKLRVFDFDDTLFTSDSNVKVIGKDGKVRSMTPEVFATYKQKKGETFDFSEFEDVKNPKPAKMLGVLDAIVRERGGEGAAVLTARPQAAAKAIKGVLEQRYGKEVADKIKIKGVESADPQDKARWIAREAIKGGFGNVYFADDSQKNVDAVGDVLNKTRGMIGRSQKVEYSAPEGKRTRSRGKSKSDLDLDALAKKQASFRKQVESMMEPYQGKLTDFTKEKISNQIDTSVLAAFKLETPGAYPALLEAFEKFVKEAAAEADVVTEVKSKAPDVKAKAQEKLTPKKYREIPDFPDHVYKYETKDGIEIDNVVDNEIAILQGKVEVGKLKESSKTITGKFDNRKPKDRQAYFRYIDKLYANMHPMYWRILVGTESPGLPSVGKDSSKKGYKVWSRGGRFPGPISYPGPKDQVRWLDSKAQQYYGVETYAELMEQNPPGVEVIPWGQKGNLLPQEGHTSQEQFANFVTTLSRFISELPDHSTNPDMLQALILNLNYAFTRRVMPEVGGQQQIGEQLEGKSEGKKVDLGKRYKDLLFEHVFPGSSWSMFLSKVARAAMDEKDFSKRSKMVQKAMGTAAQNAMVLQISSKFDDQALTKFLSENTDLVKNLKDVYGIDINPSKVVDLKASMLGGFDMRTDHSLSRYANKLVELSNIEQLDLSKVRVGGTLASELEGKKSIAELFSQENFDKLSKKILAEDPTIEGDGVAAMRQAIFDELNSHIFNEKLNNTISGLKSAAEFNIQEEAQAVTLTGMQKVYSRLSDHLDKVKGIVGYKNVQFNPLQKASNKYLDAVVPKLQKAWPNAKIFVDSQNWNKGVKEWKVPSNYKGFVTPTGEIYLNPTETTFDTPIHEFSHMWAKDLMRKNPKLWLKGKELLRGSKYHRAVHNNPAYRKYLETGQQARYWEEVMANAIGKRGAELFTEQSKQSQWNRWMDAVGSWIKSRLGIESNKDYKNLTLEDWLGTAVHGVFQGSADFTLNNQQAEYSQQELDLDVASDTKVEAAHQAGLKAEGKWYTKPLKWLIPPAADDYHGLVSKIKSVAPEKVKEVTDAFVDAHHKHVNDVSATRKKLADLEKAIGERLSEQGPTINGVETTIAQAIQAYHNGVRTESLNDFMNDKDVKAYYNYVNNNNIIQTNDNFLVTSPDQDIFNYLNKTLYNKNFADFKNKADEVFNDDAMLDIEAEHGAKYKKAVGLALDRMKTGKNNKGVLDGTTSKWNNWATGSVGTIMFFNFRSAALQMMSVGNFAFETKSPGKFFAQMFNPSTWAAAKELYNDPYLQERRARAGFDVNANEMADLMESSKDFGSFTKKVLNLGFRATSLVDSMAIAMGGAAFMKAEGGKTPETMRKWKEATEEAQQSSRPDRVSQWQTEGVSKFILAFANTPQQYFRMSQKAFREIRQGKNVKANVMKMGYYMAVQNAMFTMAQAASTALLGAEDDEEKKEAENALNSMAGTILRGMGIYGAVIDTAKNVIVRAIQENRKGRPDHVATLLKAASISPPLSRKINDLVAIGKGYNYNNEDRHATAVAKGVAVTTNLPTDWVQKKYNATLNLWEKQFTTWQKILMLAGWSEYQFKNKEDQNEGFDLDDLDLDIDLDLDDLDF